MKSLLTRLKPKDSNLFLFNVCFIASIACLLLGSLFVMICLLHWCAGWYWSAKLLMVSIYLGSLCTMAANFILSLKDEKQIPQK